MFFNARKPESIAALLRAGVGYALSYLFIWAILDRMIPTMEPEPATMIAMTFFFTFGEMAARYRLARRDRSVAPEHAIGLGLVGVAFVAGAWFFWVPPAATERWWTVGFALAFLLAFPLYLLIGGATAALRERR